MTARKKAAMKKPKKVQIPVMKPSSGAMTAEELAKKRKAEILRGRR